MIEEDEVEEKSNDEEEEMNGVKWFFVVGVV